MPESIKLAEVPRTSSLNSDVIVEQAGGIQRLPISILSDSIKSETRADYIPEIDSLRVEIEHFITNFQTGEPEEIQEDPTRVQSPESFSIPFAKIPNSAALILTGGQSNAVFGENIPLDSDFQNVKTMSFENILANPDDPSLWAWHPFSSQLTYSLKDDLRNYSRATMSYYFARTWQDRINAGENLPDLYLILVARAGMAFSSQWNPGYTETGPNMWDTVYSANKQAISSLLSQYECVRHLGLIWNQWESDVQGNNLQYYNFLTRFLSRFDRTGEQIPFTFFHPVSKLTEDTQYPEAMQAVYDAFDRIQEERPGVLRIDFRNDQDYNDADQYNGVCYDRYHYKSEVYSRYLPPLFSDIISGGSDSVQSSFLNNGIIITEEI